MSGECKVEPVFVLVRVDGVLVDSIGGAEDQLVKAGTPMNWLDKEDRVVEAYMP